jgi:hypothetical protein
MSASTAKSPQSFLSRKDKSLKPQGRSTCNPLPAQQSRPKGEIQR